MMEMEIDLTKSIHENAAKYYEKSKKAKKKLAGVKKSLPELKKKAELIKKKEQVEEKEIIKKRPRQWYEKFRWFETSDGHLVIGGKDAKTNEIIVKKHMNPTDIYFHAEIVGAPHVVLKSKDNSAPKSSLEEAAKFAAVFSRAWKEKIASVDVYSVKPEQVSKAAPSGEAMGTGAFMIYGKRDWFKKTPLEFAIGVRGEDGSFIVVSGPLSAIKSHSLLFVEISQGDQKKGDVAKQLKKYFEKRIENCKIDVDEIISMLPSGDLKISL